MSIVAGPVHYDDSKEIRSKGVGYYKLSLNEQERKQQLLNLKQMRMQVRFIVT